jgi:hypothetical protein
VIVALGPGGAALAAAWLLLPLALGVLSGCVGLGARGPQVEAALPAEAPPGLVRLIDREFGDPNILKVGDYYYLTGTVPRMARTRTFQPGDVQWFDLEVDLGPYSKAASDFWAFHMYRHTDGTFHGYAAVHFPFFRTMIAHFLPAEGETWTSERPILRWELESILIGDLKLGHFAYDPEVVRDDDGQLYLFYSSGHPNEVTSVDIHIKAVHMLDPATLDPDFAPRPVLSPDGYRSEDRNPRFVQILEGATVKKIQGRWVLLYSVGDFRENNYKLGVAYSDRLIPLEGEFYRKPTAPDPKDLWKNKETAEEAGDGDKVAAGEMMKENGTEVVYLIQSEHKEWPNYLGDVISGAGIGTIVNLDGQPILVFHARQAKKPIKHGWGRNVWTLPVAIDISNDRPMRDWIRPFLSKAGEAP